MQHLFLKIIKPKALSWIMFIQALIATTGSLYYSTFGDPVEDVMKGILFTGAGLTPCMLCWFARILMYPITLISLIGILKKDYKFVDYVLPLSSIGIVLEVYHYYIQMQRITGFTPCEADVPCTNVQVNYFGFITIPFLCLMAFIVITSVGVLMKWYQREHK